MSCRIKCTAHYPDAARLDHSNRVIALPPQRCERPFGGTYLRRMLRRAEVLIMVYARAAPTACASSEPHEPKHQAWAGPLLTSCNTFRAYTAYVYPPWLLQLSDFVGCCRIVTDFAPLKTRSTRDRSIPCSLQRWFFEKILDLTAVVFQFF